MRTMPARPVEGPQKPVSAPVAAPMPRSAPKAVSGPLWRSAEILDDPITAGVLYSTWSGDPAVICPAAPGAGKTRLVALLAASLADRAGLRVGVAAQTREQAAEIANRLARLTDSAQLLWGRKGSPPPVQGVRVVGGVGARFPASGGGVIVATTARWIYADHDSLGCDVMLVDEAWQATYADLGCLGAFAAQVVCVGDPGQIAPVVTLTAGSGCRTTTRDIA